MTSGVVDVRVLLTGLIDRLRQQDRAGITPTHGQVDELFDLSDRLKRAVETETSATVACAIGTCDQPGDATIGEVRYCGRHATAVITAIAAIQTLTPSLAHVQVTAESAVRQPWPPRERQAVTA